MGENFTIYISSETTNLILPFKMVGTTGDRPLKITYRIFKFDFCVCVPCYGERDAYQTVHRISNFLIECFFSSDFDCQQS